MATTTPNFGWSVPTSSDLVKNGATAIETLGDSIDASLVDLKGGTTDQVLAKNSNTDMDFKWVSDATGMTNPMTTTADVIYSSSGSTPARLGIGTAGQVLTVNSGATAPEWATPAGGGKVLQVVSATHSTSVSSSSAAYATTGLSCSITPSSATSKVLVLFTIAGAVRNSGNANTSMGMKLRRAGTDIQMIGTDMFYTAANELFYAATINSTYLDSPSTTSATTYDVFFNNPNATASVVVQVANANSVSSMVLLEIGA